MRQILNEETIQNLETLAGELRAISHWDTAYWRSRRPECYETIAFVSRQKRRGEIIVQLLGSAGHWTVGEYCKKEGIHAGTFLKHIDDFLGTFIHKRNCSDLDTDHFGGGNSGMS